MKQQQFLDELQSIEDATCKFVPGNQAIELRRRKLRMGMVEDARRKAGVSMKFAASSLHPAISQQRYSFIVSKLYRQKIY